jgi:hypothetical protein
MRQPVLVLAGVLPSVFGVGTIAGPNPGDGQRIDACLKASAEKGTSGVACIGIVADPCSAGVNPH